MDNDEEERITAVNRHLKGDKATDVCKDMKRLKSWFFNMYEFKPYIFGMCSTLK